jgi:hypothetical protein
LARRNHPTRSAGQGADLITLAEFQRSLSKRAPPAGLAPPLAALWWAGKNDWEQAHSIVMNDDGADAAWIHAYLHRVEGDLANARYWYAQAHRTPATGPLPQEWQEIAAAFLRDR